MDVNYQYSTIGVKNLASISTEQNPSDYISTVQEIVILDTQLNRNPKVQFLVGSNINQKIVHIHIELTNQKLAPDAPELLYFSLDEQIITQQQASIKNRISSFFTSKLGFQGQQDQSQRIIDIHCSDKVLILVTSKTLIFLRRQDCQKIYEVQWDDVLRNTEAQNEALNRDLTMRELTALKYLSSDSIIDGTNLHFNLNVFKKQRAHQDNTYQSNNEAYIVQLLYTFSLHDKFKEVEQPRYLSQDLSELQIVPDDINKAFSLSFKNGQDLKSILFIETSESDSLVIEQSLTNYLGNHKFSRYQIFLGYSIKAFESYKDLILITSTSIEKHEFTENFLDINQSPPILLDQQQNAASVDYAIQGGQSEERKEILRQSLQPEVKLHISDKEQIKNYLHGLLDQCARNCLKNQNDFTQAIKNQVDQLISNIPLLDCIQQLRLILLESINQNVGGNLFSNINQDNQILQEDGLIFTSIQIKENKLRVIKNFLQYFNIRQNDPNYAIFLEFDHYYINLQIAKYLREYQEELKKTVIRARSSQLQELPLEIRFLNTVIERTSDKLGFDRNALNQRGTNSLNLVYSQLSEFQVFIETLLDTCLDRKQQSMINARSQEDQYEVARIGIRVLEFLLQKINLDIEKQIYNLEGTFLKNLDFYEKLFRIIIILSDGVVNKTNTQEYRELLKNFSLIYFDIMISQGFDTTQNYIYWRDSIIFQIEQKIGIPLALEFAENYQASKILCRLVYEGGKEFYQILYRSIEKWGPAFQQFSMEEIYDLEKQRIQRAVSDKNPQTLSTFDPSYKGFVMFDIFLKIDYQTSFQQFLEERNIKLYAIFLFKVKAYNEAQLISDQIIPQIKYIDTQKAFSSINDMSTHIINEDKGIYYNAKYELARVQRDIRISQNELLPVTKEIFDLSLQNQLNKGATFEDAFEELLRLLDYYYFGKDNLQPDIYDELNEHVWSLIVTRDKEKIFEVKCFLPGEGLDLHSEEEIKRSAEDTLLSKMISRNLHKQNGRQYTSKMKEFLFKNVDFSIYQKGIRFICGLFDSKVDDVIFSQFDSQMAYQ